MRILALSIAVGAALLAQEPARIAPPAAEAPKAPPRVDKALRSRVQFFFQAHVDGKPRLADAVVAEDSKDIFFAMQKPRYLSCAVGKIDYSNNFTRATATVTCEEDVMMMGIGIMRIKMPRSSEWKLTRGKWYWHVDPNAIRQTPFGPMMPVSRSEGGAAPPTPFVMPKGPTPEELLKLVKADKNEVRLSSSEPSSDTVTISNGMAGWITLRLETPPIPGLEVKLDRKQVQKDEQARMTIHYEPKDNPPPKPARINVVVEPTGLLIPIRVTFGAPAPVTDKQPK
ncbi:MAG: hypothetical protein ABSE56_19840 [Bryobacteraceae bacterium]|jgi:hypothetical protein